MLVNHTLFCCCPRSVQNVHFLMTKCVCSLLMVGNASVSHGSDTNKGPSIGSTPGRFHCLSLLTDIKSSGRWNWSFRQTPDDVRLVHLRVSRDNIHEELLLNALSYFLFCNKEHKNNKKDWKELFRAAVDVVLPLQFMSSTVSLTMRRQKQESCIYLSSIWHCSPQNAKVASTLVSLASLAFAAEYFWKLL